MSKPLFLLRQLRSQDTHIRQGVIPDTQLPEKIPFTMWGGLIASSVAYGAVYFILRVLCELPVETVVFWSGVVFFVAMSFFYLTPVLALLVVVLIARLFMCDQV